jgi:hypothetical protein
MLVLFKPWIHAEDLRSQGQSWVEAYEDFLENCSDEVLSCIDNMQLLHECKDSRDAHFQNRRNRRNAGLNIELQRGCRESNDFGEETDETSSAHLTSLEACHSQWSETSRGNILSALEFARESGLISSKGEHATHAVFGPENHHVEITERSPNMNPSGKRITMLGRRIGKRLPEQPKTVNRPPGPHQISY